MVLVRPRSHALPHAWLAKLLALCLAALIPALTAAPATAQDFPFGWSFWAPQQPERIQRPPRPIPSRPAPVRRIVPHRAYIAPAPAPVRVRPTMAVPVRPVPARHQPASEAAAPRPKPVPPVKAATAEPGKPDVKPFTVAVIGDSLAQWLATGLTEAFPSGSGINILAKTRDSSGLVREDFFDWPKAARELIESTPVDALVVMIGSNDRQALRGPNGPEEPLSAAWEALYGKRIEALLAPARDKKIPIFWVGLPIMKNDRYSLDIGAINEIERTRSEALGVRFIDVFDAFADEKGAYSAFGPDIRGQIVKLRTPDGIHFTPAGARKLAHFVENDLRRLYETARPPPEPAVASAPPPGPASPGEAPMPEPEPSSPASTPAATAALPAPAQVAPRAAPAPKPAAGAVLSLTAQPTSPGGALLGGQAKLSDAQRAAIERGASEAQAGRADQPGWPRLP